jgi:hypothetical protein
MNGQGATRAWGPGRFVLPRDIPLDEYPGPDVFLHEGRRLVDEATARGLTIRVMGPLALHYYFPERIDLYARLERLGERYFTDIDLASYAKQGSKLIPFMREMGYDTDLETMALSGDTRQIYFGGAVPMIDVFFDKLDYCHEVRFRDRLELDPHCIALTDILLQKLQIVEINDKDLKDIEFLLVAGEIGDDDRAKINGDYIAKRFADDWGFWYTATQLNVPKVKSHCETVPALSAEMRELVRGKADALLARIDEEPKTRAWNRRAKKGTSKTWYQEGFSDW